MADRRWSLDAALGLARVVVLGTDEPVTAIARCVLANLGDQAAIDEVCRLWAETGDPVLGGLIEDGGWVASGPAEVRVRTAVRAGRPEALFADGPEVVAPLVALADDEVASRALAGLTNTTARREACWAVIHGDHPAALAAVVAAGFELATDAQRLLLWFLAGERERYEALDADHVLLATTFASADPALQARLRAQANRIGRPELVAALDGVRRRRHPSEMSDTEWERALVSLSAVGREADLWSLVLEVPPRRSAPVLRLLGDRGWQPPAPADRGPYAELLAWARACHQERPSLSALTELLVTLESGHCGVPALTITPDGSLLASAGAGGSVRLWSLPDGRPMATLDGHTGGVFDLAVSPDGSYLASVSREIFDQVLSDSRVEEVARGNPGLLLWSIPDCRALPVPSADVDSTSAAILPDGTLLNVLNGTMYLRSLTDDRLARLTLEGHTGYVHAHAVTPDGSLLASGGQDATVRLWSLPDGLPLTTMKGHTGPVGTVALTPDGSLLASASSDESVRVWSLPEGRPLATVTGHTRHVSALALAPDGSFLAGVAGGVVMLWSLPDGRLLSTLDGHTGYAGGLAITPDGSLLASAGSDGTVRLWGSALDRRSRYPLATIGVGDLDWLSQVLGGGLPDEERAWAELILGLVRFRTSRAG